DRRLQVRQLLLEQAQALVDHVHQQADLRGQGMRIIKAQIVRDVPQREAQPLAAENEDQPRPVAAPEDAAATDPLGMQQLLALVEADGAGRDAELAGEIGDRIQLAALRLSPVHCRPPAPDIPPAVPSSTACRSGSWGGSPGNGSPAAAPAD